MPDALDLLRAALTAPGQHHEADLVAMQAAVIVLEQLGEGAVEWGVRYEFLSRNGWIDRTSTGFDDEQSARAIFARAERDPGNFNVEVVSRRRYVTDWQPVEPQP